MPEENHIDLSTVFEFQSGKNAPVGVYLATLLQCLCHAEKQHLVPPLEADWLDAVIPASSRDLFYALKETDEATGC
jgi:hypothetical protein